LSLTPTTASGKPKTPIRLKPLHREGLQILYRVKSLGLSSNKLAQTLNVHPSSISRVVHGKCRSARIESEIARILGKESWNDVVLEARSEVQKKPVKVIKQEIERQIQAVRKAAEERMSDYMSRNADRAMMIVSGGKVGKKRRGA